MNNKNTKFTLEDWLNGFIDFHHPLYPLNHNSLQVRWTDSSKIIRLLQSEIKSNKNLSMHMSELESRLMQLNQQNLWIKSKDTIFPMSLYDVYLTLMSHLKKGDFEDVLFDGHEISFISPSGPYKSSTVVELISKTTFLDFLSYQVLKNKLPHRGFRLHTNGQVKVIYGQDLTQVSRLNVKQVTDNGVLFSSNDEILLDSITHGEVIKVLIDTSGICQLMEGKDLSDINDLFYTDNELRYFVTNQNDIISSLSYDSAITGEFYLFIRYWHMHESELPSVFNELISFGQKSLFAA